MARSLSRREAVLLGGLVLVVVGWFLFRGGEGFRRGEAAAEQEELASLAEAPAVRMDLLDPRDVEFDQAGRDLFKYGKKPLTAEERARIAERSKPKPPPPTPTPPRPPPRTTPAVSRPSAPQLPKINVKYLGYLGPKDDRIAVFSDGDEVIVARVGEVIQEQFRVVEIQYESVVMGYTRPDLENKTQTLQMARR